MVTKGEAVGEEWIESLGFANANSYGYPHEMDIQQVYCIAQVTIFNILS